MDSKISSEVQRRHLSGLVLGDVKATEGGEIAQREERERENTWTLDTEPE